MVLNFIEGLLLKGNNTLIEVLEKLGLKEIFVKIFGIGLENMSFKEFKEKLSGLNVPEIKQIMDALKIREKEK